MRKNKIYESEHINIDKISLDELILKLQEIKTKIDSKYLQYVFIDVDQEQGMLEISWTRDATEEENIQMKEHRKEELIRSIVEYSRKHTESQIKMLEAQKQLDAGDY